MMNQMIPPGAAGTGAAAPEVVLSTQVLLESTQDVAAMRKIADNGDFMVEANDMGAVHRLEGKPFVAGPVLNVYHEPTLDVLSGLGARRWVMPLEMGRAALVRMQGERRPLWVFRLR